MPESSGESDDSDPQNAPGSGPPEGPTDRPRPQASDDDRWGDLPVQVRELFRVQGGDDLPPRYRDWIDAYYRRLNRRP